MHDEKSVLFLISVLLCFVSGLYSQKVSEIKFDRKIEIQSGKIGHAQQAEKIISANGEKMIPDGRTEPGIFIIIKGQW